MAERPFNMETREKEFLELRKKRSAAHAEMKLQEDIEDNAWRYALYEELLYISDQKDKEIIEREELDKAEYLRKRSDEVFSPTEIEDQWHTTRKNAFIESIISSGEISPDNNKVVSSKMFNEYEFASTVHKQQPASSITAESSSSSSSSIIDLTFDYDDA